MYAHAEKSKENTSSVGRRKSKAIANFVTQKQGVGFVDNRPEAIMQRKTLEMSKKSLDKNQSMSARSTLQLFAVPVGLQYLKDEVVNVSSDIQKHTLPNGTGGTDELYGSEQWGKDTYWAANRKLDEWNLVKTLVASGNIELAHATHIGFGIDDTKEPDGTVYNKEHNIIVAGENKIVSGEFSQVSVNINSALSQLTEGQRAQAYNGIPLIARVNISEQSTAFEHYKGMNDSVKKGMQTRWRNRLENAHKEGQSNWKSENSLSLKIFAGSTILFNAECSNGYIDHNN